MAITRCHRRSGSSSDDSESSNDSSCESDTPTIDPLALALAILPWFESVADTVLHEETIPRNATKLSFYKSFRCEAIILRLRLDYARGSPTDQLSEECTKSLDDVLEILEEVLSYDLFAAAKIKRPKRSKYPRLETLSRYQEILAQDNEKLCESYLFLEVGEREKDWNKLLRRIERKNKKLEKLLDKFRRSPSIIPETKSTRKPPSSQIRRLGCALYDVLSRRWPCNCLMPHEANMRLATNRKFDNANERIEFEVLLSTNCLPYRWQESSFCVLIPKQKTKKAKIKFAGDDTAEMGLDYPVRQAINTICQPIGQAKNSNSCLNVLVDNDNIFQIPPTNKRGLVALAYPSITLASLLQSNISFSQKEKRILGMILAYAMLQMCESPWMNREWNKHSVVFFYDSADPSSPDTRRPYISSRFAPVSHGQDQQALHRIHRHPSILALGILLLELEFGSPIESYREASGCGSEEVNVNTDYTTALWLLDQCGDDVYENYKAAIQACLECKFVATGETFEHEGFRKAVYENIVVPLEDELFSGFKISVDNLDELLDVPPIKRGLSPNANSSGFRQSPDFSFFNVLPMPLGPLAPRGASLSPDSRLAFTPPIPREPTPCSRFSLFDDEAGGITSTNSIYSDNWFRDFEDQVLSFVDVLDEVDKPIPRNVKIAILDTGFDRKDPAIRANRERIKGMRSWTAGGKTDDDLVGHGTHTASLLMKIAPNADIYVGRIAENNHLETPDLIAEAIKWAADDCDVDIITMSFGFPRRIDSIQNAIQAANAKNKIMFAAASNNGGNRHIAYPANQFSRVITINSTDGFGNDSSFSPTPDPESANFATLGEAVESSWPAHLGVGYTQRKSGTSFATPIAAGIAAVILEYTMQKLPFETYPEASRLQSFEGMKAILKLMSEERKGYRYIKPWKFLSSWENSQSFVCENILKALREI